MNHEKKCVDSTNYHREMARAGSIRDHKGCPKIQIFLKL